MINIDTYNGIPGKTYVTISVLRIMSTMEFKNALFRIIQRICTYISRISKKFNFLDFKFPINKITS